MGSGSSKHRLRGRRGGRVLVGILVLLVAGVAGFASLAAAETDTTGTKSTDWRMGHADEIDFDANALAAFNASPYFMFTEVYDLLLNWDLKSAAPDKEHSLATNYTVSPDGKTWTFQLRTGVKWADGVPFTPDDVVFTWNLVKTTDNTLSGYARFVKSVRAAGD